MRSVRGAWFVRVAAALIVACGGVQDGVVIVTGVEPPRSATPAWVIGIARNAKLGAVVLSGDHAVYCDGPGAWSPELEGKPVFVTGALTRRSTLAPPVGPRGERSAGADGTAWMLASCARPDGRDSGELIDVEHALFAAIARRDQAQLARLAAPEFVLRMPGQADIDRAAFVRGVAAIPGEILEVSGEGVRAHQTGDTGIVEGVQVARVRIDGNVIEDRGAFVDVFVRRRGAWQLSFALNVPLTAAP
jgi:ketosteroid isomerase-like protein